MWRGLGCLSILLWQTWHRGCLYATNNLGKFVFLHHDVKLLCPFQLITKPQPAISHAHFTINIQLIEIFKLLARMWMSFVRKICVAAMTISTLN